MNLLLNLKKFSSFINQDLVKLHPCHMGLGGRGAKQMSIGTYSLQ